MAILNTAAVLSVVAFAFTSTPLAIAASSCEITQCRSGGKVGTCWASMVREARLKAKSCGRVIVGSGSSSYAMALALPRACIKASAVINIHRPYTANMKAVPIGSRWHNFYFGRIKPSAVNYFRAHGGMKRDGYSNAMFMVGVPAAKTGLPICSAL
jgi:hypothetical protein